MVRELKTLAILLTVLSINSTLIQTPLAKAAVTLELDASYEEETLNLTFLLGTPESALWVNYLVLMNPTIQIVHLWSVFLPVTDPPHDIPISFPLASGQGTVGIWTSLFTEGGIQVCDLAWVDTDIPSIIPLPDTGIELCYDDTQEIECPALGEPFYGQDAQYVTNPMSFTLSDDGTLTDNVTGLMWQQKYYDVPRSWYASIDYCDGLRRGGHTDWRIPDEYELQDIVDYGHYQPAIDTAYFSGTMPYYYWSSSTYAVYASDAWTVNFYSGGVIFVEKNDNRWVRCARGEQREQSFTDNGDGTVTDNVTGLMWQQEGDDVLRIWEDALAYCEDLELAGHTDWRLPNIKALRSIMDNKTYNPAIDTSYFPSEVSSYWSSSTDAFNTTAAWCVSFADGHTWITYKGGNDSVRCVR